MASPRFFSLKWQILLIVGSLSFILLAGLLGYWQFTLNRATQLGYAEERKTITALVDTFYSQWHLRNNQQIELTGKDRKLAMAVAGGILRNHDKIEEYLFAHRFLTGASFLGVSSLRGESVSVTSIKSDIPDLNEKGKDSGIVCSNDGICWELVRLPLVYEGLAVGTIAAAFPFSDFFKVSQTAPYSASVRFIAGDEIPPFGWTRLDNTLIQLPGGFQVAASMSQQTPLAVIHMTVWSMAIVGAVTFVLLQLMLAALLFERLSYIKKIITGIPIMLDKDSDLIKLKTQLGRSEEKKFLDELDVIGNAMVQAGEELRRQPATIKSVSDDVIQLKLTNFLANERKLLLAKFAKKEEEMRRNLANDLHDEVGARLVSMKVDLLMLKQNVEITDEGKDRIERFERNCKALNDFLHSTMENLSPSILVDFGLSGAVSALVDEWRANLKGVTEFKLNTRGDLHSIPFAQATASYRIVQESLTNVAKYAKANHVEIDLKRSPENTITINVIDDGVGFDQSAPGGSGIGGRGLQGIKDRVEGFGGTVQITSEPGKGTRILCSIPVTLEKTTLDVDLMNHLSSNKNEN